LSIALTRAFAELLDRARLASDVRMFPTVLASGT
jgi:hypothetical protein